MSASKMHASHSMRSFDSRFHLAVFQRDIVLLGAGPLLLDHFIEQVPFLAGRDRGANRYSLVIVELGLEQTAESDVAGDWAADFDVDVFARVIANPLGKDRVVIPADEGGVFCLEVPVDADF